MEFEAGREAYERGNFGEALRHYDLSYALNPQPAMLFNIGRAADADGATQRAISAYGAYLDALPTAENSDFVRARLTKLRDMGAPPPGPPAGAVTRTDREAAVTSSPVPAALRPTAVQEPSASASALAPASTRVADAPSSVAKPFYKRAWFWTTVGAVIVVGVTATAIAATNRDDGPHRTSTDLQVETLRWR